MRSVKHALAVGVVYALVAAQGHAYTASTTSCRTWTDLRASARAVPEMNWIEGYVMALLDHNSLLAKHTQDISGEKVNTWIDHYCTQQPEQSLHVAVHALELWLIKAYKRQGP
jgi:hypothetical protein